MWQKLSAAVAILVLLLARLVHNVWVDRWQNSAERNEAVARLERLPQTVGPWQGQTLRLNPAEVAQAQLAGYVWRRYRHDLTGDVVSILLVCGPPGAVSVHTPDVCYKGAGYEMIDQPVRCTVSAPFPRQAAEFMTAQFHKPNDPLAERLRIYWSWNGRGQWEAAENPRLTFGGLPVLYKLYVIWEVAPTEGEQDRDPCKEFLDLWLPELQKALSSPHP